VASESVAAERDHEDVVLELGSNVIVPLTLAAAPHPTPERGAAASMVVMRGLARGALLSRG
jgi:hypothetical protein